MDPPEVVSQYKVAASSRQQAVVVASSSPAAAAKRRTGPDAVCGLRNEVAAWFGEFMGQTSHTMSLETVLRDELLENGTDRRCYGNGPGGHGEHGIDRGRAERRRRTDGTDGCQRPGDVPDNASGAANRRGRGSLDR